VSNADDKLVDEYLSGATPYSERYRRIAAEAVSEEVDAAVLGQVKPRATKSRQQLWWRIGPPLAVAATAVLAISVVMRSNQESLTAVQSEEAKRAYRTVTTETQQPRAEVGLAASAPPAVSPVPLPQEKSDTETGAELKKEIAATDRLRQAPTKSAPASSPPQEKSAHFLRDVPGASLGLASADKSKSAEPVSQRAVETSVARAKDAATSASGTKAASGVASTTPAASPPVDAGERRADADGRNAGNEKKYRRTAKAETVVVTGSFLRGASQNAALPVQAITSEELQPSQSNVIRNDPKAWLQSIRQLRKDGKQVEADEQWKLFAAAYPNYAVAKNDAARPKSK